MREGNSQHHGHCHMLLGERFHYGRWEYLQHCMLNYNREHRGRNYFMDLIRASDCAGLVKTIGQSHIVVSLTPALGYHMEVISWNYDQDFFDAINVAIQTLLQRFKTLTFNIGIFFPPLDLGRIRRPIKPEHMDVILTSDDAPMPFIAYLVDRDDENLGRNAADVCTMHLHGTNIVSLDPFQIGKVVRVPEILWMK